MSKKPASGFRPTVEVLEDRFLLSTFSFRSAATGFFPSNPKPGLTVNLPTSIATPLRASLPTSPLHTTNVPTTILSSQPSAQTIGILRGNANTSAQPLPPGNVNSPNAQVHYTPPIFSNSPGITAGASNVPGQSSGAGINPGLPTNNLTVPAANAAQNPTTFNPNFSLSNPTNSAGSTPWWLF